MPSPDLPIELWLEILVYLPRSALRKMIGVNRTLFELALDDLYEEVRFISDDEGMTKVFEQLVNHPSIARRVRHLLIRPAFLPALNESQATQATQAQPRTIFRKRSKIVVEPQITSPILDIATRAVKSCPHLREVTLAVHDHAILDDFKRFLEALWTQESITKVAIDTTMVKIPLLLPPLELSRRLLEFDINVSVSRLPATRTECGFARRAFLDAIIAFKDNLATLTFSSLASVDFGDIFDYFPRLPNLKKFEFLVVFNLDSFGNTVGLTKFIGFQHENLETLVLRPHAKQVSLATSDDSYSIWLDHKSPQKYGNVYTLNQIQLPKLRTFDVGLQVLPSDTLALPPIARFAPSLTRLIISNAKLSQRQLVLLLEGLVKSNGTSSLEDLSFDSLSLTSTIFDTIAEKLPKLKRLAINCGPASLVSPWLHVDHLRLLDSVEKFLHEIEPRRYPQWKLERLHLSHKRESCGNQHPSVSLMKQVAQCFPKPISLEVTHNCDECERDKYYL